MSYFLKQTKIKNRVFLQISETTYNKITKKSSNRCYKKLGYFDELISNDIPDPISYYKDYVSILNEDRKNSLKQEKETKISNCQEIRIGYFLGKSILDSIRLKERIQDFCEKKGAPKKYYDIIETLIYCKIIYNSENDSHIRDGLNYLYDKKEFNEKELFETLEFLGNNYSDIINIFNECIQKLFPSSKKYAFFDSFKSFYNDICLTQSIYLDEDLIPVGFNITNNNETKFNISNDLRVFQNKFTADRVIHVADRGINYGNNLYNSIVRNNGYIFPLSLSSIIDEDKKWVLNEMDYESVYNDSGNLLYKLKENSKDYFTKVIKNDGSSTLFKSKQRRVAVFLQSLYNKKKASIYKLTEHTKILYLSNAQKNEYSRTLKYIKIIKEEGKEDKIIINTEKIENEIKYAGYKVLVTSEEDIERKQVFYIADIVWKIENYFRTIKTQVDTNKEFEKDINRIYGHLVLCYFLVVIYRIFQKKIFKCKFTTEEILNFSKNAKFLKNGNVAINLLNNSPLIEEIETLFKIPLTNLYLDEKQIHKILNTKISSILR